MRTLASIFAWLTLLFHPHHAHGQTIITGGGSVSAPVNCPQAVDGGCAASLGGNFQQGNFNTHAQQSGQTWTGAHPWNWNSCGVDYKCGYYTATGSLQRADQISTAPLGNAAANCTYTSNGGSGGGPIIKCNGVANLSVIGIDFTNTGSGTGTTCVPLELLVGQTGTVTIKDNKWINASGCWTNVFGDGNRELIDADSQSTAALDLENNYIDGTMYTASQITGCLFISMNGGATIKYNAIFRCEAQPIHFATTTQGGVGILSEFNYVEDFQFVSGGHGEFWQASTNTGTVPAEQSSFDTILQGSGVEANGTTALVTPHDGNGGTIITTAQIDHLVGIVNKSGGTTVSGDGIGFFGTRYNQINIQTNFYDDTGAINTPWAIQEGGCTNATSMTGNVSLLTGNPGNSWGLNPSTSVISGTYNSSTGAVSLSINDNANMIFGGAGNIYKTIGLTGTGSVSSLNGVQISTAGTAHGSPATFNYTAATGLGTITITGGTLGTGC